jgi:type II secretory pathway pseudopilin PulG
MKSFTLIELLIIIGIIGILTLIGVPAFRAAQPGIELAGQIRDLATDLRYAQQLSVSEQLVHGVRFFTSDSKYQIIRYGATEEILKEKFLSDNINFHQITGFGDASPKEAKFNSYGAAVEEGEIILINTKNQETQKISVKPSGFVKICD